MGHAPGPVALARGRRGRQPGLEPQAGQVRGPGPWSGGRAATPYAELHCHSNFSFLDGASHAEELAEEAVRLGLEALALTDHDGFYGVVRFAEAAKAYGLPTVFGAELTLGMTRPQMGEADPEGDHLVVLARDPVGYARLGTAISRAQMAGEKGAPRTSLAELAGDDRARDHWLVLTGCRKGAVPRALVERGPAAAQRELARLVDAFGRENVAVELWDHGDPLDSARNDGLAEVAVRLGVDVVATNNVHYATPSRRRLATALAAVRARRSLDEIDGWLPGRRPGPTCARATSRPAASPAIPGAVDRAAALGRECAFDLQLVAPNLPPFPCPPGHDEMSFLRQLTEQGAQTRYGPTNGVRRRRAGGVPADRPRAGHDRAAGVPGVLPGGLGHRALLPGAAGSSARGGAAPPTRRSATPSGSPTPTP